jgi:hypothetical protein
MESPHWKSIQDANEFRNCIAHANGKISNSSNSQKVEVLLKEIPLVSQNDGYLILTKEYVTEFFNSCYQVVESILKDND